MLGMPVENQAVARSPQGMAIAIAEPPAKSIRRQLCASGTSSITPFRRTRPLLWPSLKDFNQGPRGAWTHWPSRIERQNEVGCVGQRLLEHGGDAIGGNDIESTPGQITIPAVSASTWRRCAARKTSISPVISISGFDF